MLWCKVDTLGCINKSPGGPGDQVDQHQQDTLGTTTSRARNPTLTALGGPTGGGSPVQIQQLKDLQVHWEIQEDLHLENKGAIIREISWLPPGASVRVARGTTKES